MESKSSKTSNKKDPGWNYNCMKDPKKRYRVTCNFCLRTFSGGISRAKEHQLGGSRNVKGCDKVPSELKEELEALYGKKQESNVRGSQNEPDCNNGDDADDVEVEEAEQNSKRKRASVEKPVFSKAKKSKRQKSMNDPTDPARETTIQYIARFFDEAGISFDAAQLDSFMVMVEAIGQYGPGLKPPSYHDAAGSSGGATAQSFPHNEEFQPKDFMAFLEMPVIKELWEAFGEAYKETSKFQPKDFMAFLEMPVIKELWEAFGEAYKETSKGKTKEAQEFSEEFRLLDEVWPVDMTEEGEKLLDGWPKGNSLQERLKEFFEEEEGITKKFTEKFKAVCLKYKQEVKRQYKEALGSIFKEDDTWDLEYLKNFPPIPTGNFLNFSEDGLLNLDFLKIFPKRPTGNFTGPSNVSSNCEKELQ